MIEKTKRIAIVIALLFTLLIGVTLFACNPPENKAAAARDKAVSDFVDAVVSGVDPEWRADMSVNELVLRKDAGEFVLLKQWSGFFGGVLKKSGLYTGTINALNEFLRSDSGKALLSNNASIPIGQGEEDPSGGSAIGEIGFSELIANFNQIGITSVDVTEIVYLSVSELLDGYEKVFENCVNELTEIRNTQGISYEVKSEISSVLANVNSARASFGDFAAAGNEIESSLEAAKPGLGAIIDFAFGVSSLSFTGDLLDSITGGALENISENETVAYVSGIVSQVKTLETALTDEQINKIDSAMKLALDKLDGVSVNSSLFDELLSAVSDYFDYVYSAVDYLPLVCELFEHAASAIDVSFVEGIKDSFEKGAPEPNKGIYMAKLIGSAFGGVDKAKFIESFEKKIDSTAEYRKGLVLMKLDLAVNVLAFNFYNIENGGDLKPTFMSESDFADIFNMLTVDTTLDDFKTAYSGYSGSVSEQSRLRSLASSLTDYSGNDPALIEFGKEWYDAIVSDVNRKLNEDYERLLPVVQTDLKRMLSDFIFNGFTTDGKEYESYLSAINEYAAMKPLTSMSGEAYDNMFIYYAKTMLIKIFDADIH